MSIFPHLPHTYAFSPSGIGTEPHMGCHTLPQRPPSLPCSSMTQHAEPLLSSVFICIKVFDLNCIKSEEDQIHGKGLETVTQQSEINSWL